MLGVLGLKCSVKESKTAQDIHDHLPQELEFLFIESGDTQDFQHNIKKILQWLQKKLNLGLLNTNSTKDK